jgi:retron-type reverse transcriptase
MFAGYFEFRTFQHSLTGTPQGSIISPILANILLEQLDKFVEQLAEKFSKGKKARHNPVYTKLRYFRKQDENQEIARNLNLNLLKQMQTLPYADPFILT